MQKTEKNSDIPFVKFMESIASDYDCEYLVPKNRVIANDMAAWLNKHVCQKKNRIQYNNEDHKLYINPAAQQEARDYFAAITDGLAEQYEGSILMRLVSKKEVQTLTSLEGRTQVEAKKGVYVDLSALPTLQDSETSGLTKMAKHLLEKHTAATLWEAVKERVGGDLELLIDRLTSHEILHNYGENRGYIVVYPELEFHGIDGFTLNKHYLLSPKAVSDYTMFADSIISEQTHPGWYHLYTAREMARQRAKNSETQID